MSLAVQAESHLEEPVVAHVGWAAVQHIDTGGLDCVPHTAFGTC